MGLLKPLGDEVSVHVDAPVDRVWALVSDVTRIGEFSPETFEARWTRGHTGPEVGATFKGHVKRNGVGPTYWSPCRVTVCEPERVFEFAVGTEAVPVNNWGYRLEPEAGGTRVTEYFRLHPSLPVRIYWFVLGRLRGRTNRAGMRTTLERMKKVLEEER
ncbi:SRPBCC family protein [Nocardioides zeae]|uniref:SRPBCC family protein n=1 Tax=Nocardioides imazamoxiresistens TaxID=3231893 RepID=A0ABU3PUI0_9ACTN|nr:SRPBCC family protein [Nocardioides zeae]MDT9592868.1 SRPBCC family protein [Nocardioides zeae]